MARKISECRHQMHLLENEKSIRSLPKPVRQRNSKILLAVIYSARRQQFSSRGFFKPKWLTLVITFLSHGIFRCSRIRSARRLQLEDVSSLDFPPTKIRPVWLTENAIIRLGLWNVTLPFWFEDCRTKPRNQSRYRNR